MNLSPYFLILQIYRRHELAGNFKPSAFREEAALMSEGENMYAFQICNIPKILLQINFDISQVFMGMCLFFRYDTNLILGELY